MPADLDRVSLKSAIHSLRAGKVFGGANLIAITQGTGSAIVHVSSPAPSNPAAWQGISGAAVFEKAGALVGVIVAHGDTVNIRRMLPIARLFGQHGALTALSQAGVPPLRQAPRCPEGVVPLGGEDTPTRGLRDYLRQRRLPYYSRSRHLAGHEAAVEDEEALLVELAGHEKPGIIVTGIGGVG